MQTAVIFAILSIFIVVDALRRLQNIATGVWDSSPGVRNSYPPPRADLVKSYAFVHQQSGTNSKIVEDENIAWRPDNPSLVRPVLDSKGSCIALHHLVRAKRHKKEGGILFIGDEISARASMTLAASLNAHETSPSCSHATSCQHRICGNELSVHLQFMSSKDFLLGACLSSSTTTTTNKRRQSSCTSELLLTKLVGFDVIVFGLSHYLSALYTQEGATRTNLEITSLAQWVNEQYAPRVNESTLFVYQSLLPYDKYCDTRNRTDEALHQSFLLLTSAIDDRLYHLLQEGTLGQQLQQQPLQQQLNIQIQHKHLSLTRVDIAGAVFAREEVHRSNFLDFTDADRDSCELRQVPSDSVMLLLSHVYGALLAHVTPAEAFPDIRPLEAEAKGVVEDHDRAMQRVALHELNVVNYLLAQMRIHDAITQHGWKMPSTTAVTLSITDIRYAEAFAYWYYSRRMYAVEGIMVAMDAETCDHLHSTYPTYLALCMHMPHTLALAPPHKLNTIVATGKIIYPLLFLCQYNVSVIFSEMDIFWKGNPYPYLAHADRSAYDIQVSAHVFWNARKQVTTVPKELNIGFFFVRPTPGAKQLFRDMLQFFTQWPFASVDIATLDQKLFDRFIRNDPSPPGEENVCCANYFEGWRLARPASHFKGFKWLRLAGDIFTHNDAQELAIVPQTLTYHISWGIDPPSRRIHCAYTLGLLPTNYTHTTKYDKQVCFAYLYV